MSKTCNFSLTEVSMKVMKALRTYGPLIPSRCSFALYVFPSTACLAVFIYKYKLVDNCKMSVMAGLAFCSQYPEQVLLFAKWPVMNCMLDMCAYQRTIKSHYFHVYCDPRHFRMALQIAVAALKFLFLLYAVFSTYTLPTAWWRPHFSFAQCQLWKRK